MLLVPLCKSWSRAIDEAELTSPSSVLSRAYSMVIIYGLVWTLGLFTIGTRIIGKAAAAGVASSRLARPLHKQLRVP